MTRYELIFELVEREVTDSGGDGDGVVVFYDNDIQYVAGLFEAYLSSHTPPFTRHDHSPGMVSFTRPPEDNIIFVSGEEKERARKPWEDDIWLEVY